MHFCLGTAYCLLLPRDHRIPCICWWQICISSSSPSNGKNIPGLVALAGDLGNPSLLFSLGEQSTVGGRTTWDPKKGGFSERKIPGIVRSHDFSPKIYNWDHFCQHLSSVRSPCLQLAQVLYFHQGVMLLVSAYRKMLLFHQEDLNQV